ncbi:MAG: hypothetical protein M1820_000136 [Bogoriella megaspora]|nr:MAG: hypothetical protein M1820_000136 [Bogoriella megaspora]
MKLFAFYGLLLTQAAVASTYSTCASRTVNYLTHTLPQQCLRTSWSSSNATADLLQSPGSVIALGAVTVGQNDSPGPAQATSTLNEPSTVTNTEQITSETSEPQSSTTSEAVAPSHAATDPPNDDSDSDSPLDNANFLSFEEWKKQNLEKAGQSPDNVGQSHSGSNGNGEGRRRPGINNALDSLGEDQEIELDFGGFGAKRSDDAAASATGTDDAQETPEVTARSKDAGKTCKERFNYASFDCAATVLKTNPKAKSASSVLVENKDSYMLNECNIDNKFIIVELCDDILIDTVVLANFEFFSSMFRTFRISVSDRYPVKMERWRDLGTFQARNSREVQAFLVENPLIWARYLRIEFLQHYGNEFYCPLSLVRVHGTTMLEEYKHQEEAARDEEIAIEEVAENVIHSEEAKRREEEELKKREEELREQSERQEQTQQQKETAATEGVAGASNGTASESSTQAPSSSEVNPGNNIPTSTDNIDRPAQQAPDTPSALIFERDPTPTCINPANPPNSTSTAGGAPSTILTSAERDQVASQTTAASPPSSSNGSQAFNGTHTPTSPQNNTDPSPPPSHSHNQTTTPRTSTNTTTRPASSPSAQPPTQESFFKSVHKRLQTLESNSTLSLQYIESQSRILRDAFAQTQRKHLSRTEDFLHNLNTTVVGELQGFRAQYEQLWQSTVLELEAHRERQKLEMEELGVRVRLLAEEVVWQKRIGVAQGVLVLVCLGLVIFVGVGGGGTGGVLRESRSAVWEGSTGGGAKIRDGKKRSGMKLPWESPERGLGFKRRSWFTSEDSGVSQREEDIGDGEVEAEAEGDAHISDVWFDERRARRVKQSGLLTPTEISRPTTAGRSDSPEPPLSARLAPKETQSSPATPNGSRDLQDGAQGWEEAMAAREPDVVAVTRSGDAVGTGRRAEGLPESQEGRGGAAKNG